MLDAANCGGCGLSCPAGATCAVGACRATDGSVVAAINTIPPDSCAVGEQLCGTSCVNLLSDDANCGNCALPCTAGNVCDQGVCRPIGDGCPAGRTLCGDTCVDLATSADHCGTCDTSCGAGSCVQGACSCSPLETLCGGACVNTAIDAENCGMCSVACATGQSCSQGACACPTGQLLCDGACADLQADPNHCGSCEIACAAGQSCSQGACLCPAGLDLCAAGCVDLLTTSTDCGSCGTACSGGMECAGGTCACPSEQTDCGGTCFDLTGDAEHCGTCDTVCSGGQVCTGSACACPDTQTLCDDTCVDTMSDDANCGGCGTECVGGQVCTDSSCECPDTQTLCDDTCVDTMSDDANCGGCGTECMGGQTCQTGSCECPEGQSFCDGECIDTATDDLNCGGCGVACGLGELCNDSTCQGGGLGDDGCQGIAENITLDKLSFYQTVEIPVMEGGTEVADRNADVVVNRDAFVRVFVQVGSGWTPRQLSARLFLDDGEQRVTVYPDAPQDISGSSQEDDLASTFDLQVSGDMIRESTRYAIELVECGAAPGDAVASPRFPEQDGLDLGAVVTGGLRINIIPLRANGMLPDTSDAALDAFREGFLATYPIDSIEFSVSDPYDISDATAWEYNLEDLRYLRSDDNPPPEVYYYGMLRPTERIRDFCGGGCTAGIGYVPNGPASIAASGRVAMGLNYDDEESIRTMLHEVGHNHGRNHAPCVPPGASIAGVDPNYPYDNAAIGVYGWDRRSDRLLTPDHPDIMAYCDDPWFSDYTYAGILSTVRSVNQTQQSVIVDPARVGEFWVLLVKSGNMTWVKPRPGLVTADGKALPAHVLDALGKVVEDIDVYRNDMSEADAYSLDVPAPQPGWHALELPGVGRIAF
jgi:hypothetical protein